MARKSRNDNDRRTFLKSLGLGALGIASGCGDDGTGGGNSGRSGTDTRPNIVIIMADDMGYSDLGCFGGEIDTPTIDQLAANGLKYTQFYNSARCCPTRASLLTGLHPHQAGMGHQADNTGFPAYTGEIKENCVTIAEAVKSAGYSTYVSGKWHVTTHVGYWTGHEEYKSKHNWPLQRGFDRFFGTIQGAGSFFDPYTLTDGNDPTYPKTDDFYYTDAIADKAIEYVSDHVEDRPDSPFFLYMPFTAPHWPLHALPEDIEKYKGRFDEGWDSLREKRNQRMLDLDLIKPEWGITERDERVPAWEDAENKEWEVRRMEVYAAQVDRMDQAIGRVVDCLKQTGQYENTLILFLMDNGGCAEGIGRVSRRLYIPELTRDGRRVINGNIPEIMPGPTNTFQSYGIPWANVSNTPFRLYKSFVHEGGISTPLIAHWPAGIAAKDEYRHQPGHIIDIMSTCVDVAQAEYPQEFKGNQITPMEGESLVPSFTSDSSAERTLYWEHEGKKAVRKGKWKLVSLYSGEWELYDLERDRTEMNDLASSQPEKAQELQALWDSWAEKVMVVDFDKVRAKRVPLYAK